jgi:hypothetical protein
MHPSKEELEFLNLSFNRFLDLYAEMMSEDFWQKDALYRLLKSKDIFAVYAEILKYPPIQWAIEQNNRPNFSDVAIKLFKFIRHILTHFPYFNTWNDIYINVTLINLFSTKPQFIDRYLRENEGKQPIKYRFWEETHKTMTYVAVQFPNKYSEGGNIYLKYILEEKSGIKFSIIFMKSILMTQVEGVGESNA